MNLPLKISAYIALGSMFYNELGSAWMQTGVKIFGGGMMGYLSTFLVFIVVIIVAAFAAHYIILRMEDDS